MTPELFDLTVLRKKTQVIMKNKNIIRNQTCYIPNKMFVID